MQFHIRSWCAQGQLCLYLILYGRTWREEITYRWGDNIKMIYKKK